MSPTEFSNYIKQRAMQQQLHHSHGHANGHLGPIGTSSPSRSLSPNPLTLSSVQDPYFFPNNGMGMYPPQFNGPRNMFDSPQFPHPSDTSMYSNGPGGKFSPYLEPHNYYGMGPQQGNAGPMSAGNSNGPSVNGTNAQTPVSSPGSNPDSSKLLDGLNSFYSSPGPYQHLLVAN